MKTALKMALLVALCVSVASQQVRANDILQDIGAGLQIFSILRDVVNDGHSKTTKQPLRVVSEDSAVTDPINCRRVVIDEQQISITGNFGRELQELTASRLRSTFSQSRKVLAVVGPSDFRSMADLQDNTLESGRYSQETVAQVERGKWLAPTDVMKLSGSAELISDDRQAEIGGRNGLNVSSNRITMVVHLILEPIELVSGVYSQAYEATAQASKTVNFDVNGRGSGSNSRKSNAESELLYQVAGEVFRDLVNQLDSRKLNTTERVKVTRPIETAPVETASTIGSINLTFPSGKSSQISVTGNKPVNMGTQIWFVHNGKVVGKFQVLAINGQNLKLQKLSGLEPAGGDGFAIINYY